MNENSPKGTNSIVLLALRTLPHLAPSIFNFLIPIIVSIGTFFSVFHSDSPIARSQFESSISNLLQFNGAMFGLLLAGFGFYATLPSNQRTIFSIVNSPKGEKYSYFKLRLLTVFKMAFWAFVCSCIILVMYFGIALHIFDGLPLFESMSRKLKVAMAVGAVTFAQVKICIELKIYIFSIYMRGMNEARMLALEEGAEPFDKSID